MVNVVRLATASRSRLISNWRPMTSSRLVVAVSLMTEKMGLIGPEVSDKPALDIPLDTAEIVVTNKDMLKLSQAELRALPDVDQIQMTKLERGGVTIPIGTNTKLQRMDIVSVVGLKDAVSRVGPLFGRVVRPSTATDLLTLSLGMILGFLIGAIQFPAFGASIGLGNAGGLLVAGVIVSSVASRLRFFGNTPNAARNVLEDLGLIVFVAIVGINAGNSLLTQLTGALALKIFIIGFIACSIPPVIVWAIGFHVFKMNPAVLMGGVAGARSHSGPCREAAVEIKSNVPWIGFPVAYAVSGVLLTVFGYFAMILAQRQARLGHGNYPAHFAVIGKPELSERWGQRGGSWFTGHAVREAHWNDNAL